MENLTGSERPLSTQTGGRVTGADTAGIDRQRTLMTDSQSQTKLGAMLQHMPSQYCNRA
jgi:hypothetical protein